jgi:hypothetical protein
VISQPAQRTDRLALAGACTGIPGNRFLSQFSRVDRQMQPKLGSETDKSRPLHSEPRIHVMGDPFKYFSRRARVATVQMFRGFLKWLEK